MKSSGSSSSLISEYKLNDNRNDNRNVNTCSRNPKRFVHRKPLLCFCVNQYVNQYVKSIQNIICRSPYPLCLYNSQFYQCFYFLVRCLSGDFKHPLNVATCNFTRGIDKFPLSAFVFQLKITCSLDSRR